MKSDANKDKTGKSFEKNVGKLFKLMGYSVEYNKLLNHRDIDIYGELITPPTKIKIAVECKDYSKNVAMPDIDSFYAKVSPLFNEKEVDRAFLITTKGFAPSAKRSAEKLGIECYTYLELIGIMMDFSNYIDWLMETFEKNELSTYYIDLNAYEWTQKSLLKYNPIQSKINRWLNEEGKNHISILGDYGSGKTSFCEKYAHDLALKYKNNPSNNRIPILINLRDYSKAMNIRQLITDLLINEHRIRNADFKTFLRLNEEGLFLIIFDGFDEMAQKVDINVTVSNFEEISKLAGSPKSKVILTCRTQYFRTRDQEKEVLNDDSSYVKIVNRPNFDVIYLEDFTEGKIEKFLKKRTPGHWQSYFKQIKETYNLIELAKRPVLLDIIVKSLPQLVSRNEPINPGKLYETYTDYWMDRDIKRARTIINRRDKSIFMQELAYQMFIQEKLSIHYSNLSNSIKQNFKLERSDEIDYFSHDIMTCSFLSRDEMGNYKFAHKSFMEFFVAQKLCADIEKNKIEDFKEKNITHEIALFLSNLLTQKERLYEWIEFTKLDKDLKYLGSNSIVTLKFSGESFRNKDFSGAQFPSANLVRINFHNANLEGCNLNNAHW